VGVTPHDLRATHGTWLADAGVNPVDVGARLGHAYGNTKVTQQHYLRSVQGRDAEAAGKLRVVES
jgi:integrase